MSRAVAFARLPNRARRQPRHALRFKRRRFGRRRAFTSAAPPVRPQRIGDDLRLFGATFAAGFVFVSVLIV